MIPRILILVFAMLFSSAVLPAAAPEVGTNDFRVSDMGANDGDLTIGAFNTAAAYNPNAHEFLVVWSGTDDTNPLVPGEPEIFSQRVDAATGAELGVNDFRISDMGPDGDTAFAAFNPAVVFNPNSNEYLVVWFGTDDTGDLVSGEFEIFGQRLGATGAEVGNNDFRISDMGPTDGDTTAFAEYPAVSHNSVDNEYLVVWDGADNAGGLAVGEREIFGQRLSATGLEVGTNDFRISDAGPDGDAAFGAFHPDLAYNRDDNEYLAAWFADDDTGALVQGEFEIFGQRLNAATGAEVGSNDFRISDMGASDGNAGLTVREPALTYNWNDGEYLVAWPGIDDTPPIANGESEIFAQRLDAAGAEIGANDFRVSDMGPDGNATFGVFPGGPIIFDPAVDYDPTNNEYLVAWQGSDDTGDLVSGEVEIFAQRLQGGTGAEVGPNDVRLSDMGSDGDVDLGAFLPAVAFASPRSPQYLLAWFGDDDVNTLVDNEFEIFAQRIAGPADVQLGLALADIDNSGNAEAVVVTKLAGDGVATVKDAGTGNSIVTVNATTRRTVIDAKVIGDLNGNGSEDIAFLLLEPQDNQPKVEIWDPLTNRRIKNVDYNKRHEPVAFDKVTDQNGNQTEEGAVLARQLNNNNRPRLLIRDLSTKAKVTNVSLPKIFNPRRVVMGPDLNGNGSNDALVLSTRISDNKGFVNVWDTGGAGKIVNIQLPKQHEPIGHAYLSGPGGVDAVVVLALRLSDDRGRLFVNDALTGAKLWGATLGAGRELLGVAVYQTSTGTTRVALLSLRTTDQRPIVTIYDGDTGSVVTNVLFESGEARALTIFPDVSGNNEPELGVLFDSVLRLRDSDTKAVTNVIGLP
jgi:hypothetical protein